MWDDRFLFVTSALFFMGISVANDLRRDAMKAGENSKWGNRLRLLVIIGAILILFGHFVLDSRVSLLSAPSLGSLLAVVLGGVVGSFSARFIRNLFGAQFGSKEPLLGIFGLLVLIIVYSLPSYQQELRELFRSLPGFSVKIPFGVELDFADRANIKGAVVSSSGTLGQQVSSSAVARPNDPQPGLNQLSKVVFGAWDQLKFCDQDYIMLKDDCYIQFFETGKVQETAPTSTDPMLSNDILITTQTFLLPVQKLASCLSWYVDTFPDSQLFLVDIKEILQWFFRLNADAVNALKNNKQFKKQISIEDIDGLKKSVNVVINHVRTALEARLKQGTCETDNEKVAIVPQDQLNYLQPYTTIALANLLIAHGSPDEAVDVLTRWLELWRCARGEVANRKILADKCKWGPVPEADDLPEWFGIRAEFTLNTILYNMTGEANITYRDFLKEHAEHFAVYAEHPEHYDKQRVGRTLNRGSVSISARLKECKSNVRANFSKYLAIDPETDSKVFVPAQIFRSLLQNENTLLRSQLHFLADLDWSEMLDLLERAKTITSFEIGCVYPEDGRDKEFWAATLADYQVTYGLLAVAISARWALQPSADLRDRSALIRQDGIRQLRDGFGKLKDQRKADQDRIKMSLWTERMFMVSPWEQSFYLAQRTLNSLTGTEE